MTDYAKYINALRKCAKEHENDRTFTGHIIVSDLCRDTADLLERLEQEPKTGRAEQYDRDQYDKGFRDAKPKWIPYSANKRVSRENIWYP